MNNSFSHSNRKKTSSCFFTACFLFFLFILASLRPPVLEAYGIDDILKSEVVGEAFGLPVSRDGFLYYYKTASIFTRSGKQEERTDDDIQQEAWQNLIFAREARNLGIEITRQEVLEEVNRLLSEKRVEYGGKDYTVWVLNNFGENPETFEHRIEDLLTINRFLKMKLDPDVTVTAEEMKEKFLNEYNSFESEYILFGNEKDAKEFVEKVKHDPRLWFDTYQAKKSLGQKGASWINIMSLEALIDLWKIPKEEAQRILNSKPGDFIAAKNYYGDAAVRLLYARKADLKDYDEAKQQYYRKMLTSVKKHKIGQDYLNDLLKRADVRDFIAEKELADKKEKMKEKSAIILETNQGKIELKLLPDIAPFACENFIGLVEKGFYNGMTFHRVIKDFMIQGGDPTATGAGGESIWGKPFVDEISDKVRFDKPGILAMANAGSDTNTSQFFITVKAVPSLDGRHTIFGEVVSGMDAVNMIDSTPTDKNDKPKKQQKIIKAYIK